MCFSLSFLARWTTSTSPQGGQLRRLRPQGVDEMLIGRFSHDFRIAWQVKWTTFPSSSSRCGFDVVWLFPNMFFSAASRKVDNFEVSFLKVCMDEMLFGRLSMFFRVWVRCRCDGQLLLPGQLRPLRLQGADNDKFVPFRSNRRKRQKKGKRTVFGAAKTENKRPKAKIKAQKPKMKENENPKDQNERKSRPKRPK